MVIHQDGNRTLVRDSLKPLDDTILRAGTGKVPRNEDHSPLRAGLLSTLELVDHLLDILGSGPGNDRAVFEAGTLELLLYMREELKSFLIRDVNGFTGAPQNNQTSDSRLCEVDRVGCLCREVERGSDWVIVGGCLRDEEGWNRDVNACWRRSCHDG